MLTVLDKPTHTAPDLLAALAPAPSPLGALELEDFDAAITALVDREDWAPLDEVPRLRRIRALLEAEAGELLAQ